MAADYEFHRLIIAACGNTLFSNIYDTLRSFMHEEIRKRTCLNRHVAALVDEHRTIIAGDPIGEVRRPWPPSRRISPASRNSSSSRLAVS